MSYGFNQVELSGGDAWMKEPQMRQTMSGIKAIGATDVRMAAVWQFVESSRGNYKFDAIDRAVNMASEYGLAPTLVVQWPVPGWHGSATDFGNYAKALAARYGPAGTGQVFNYEIMNEQNNILNMSPPKASKYAPWLKAAFTGIKSADPDNPSSTNVITGGVMACLGGFFTTDAFEFCRNMYTAGLQGYFDSIGFHWYSNTDEFKMELPTVNQRFYLEMLAVRQAMVDNGDSAKSIWVTEFGIPTPTVKPMTTARDWMQAQIEILQALPWVGKFFIYNYRNSQSDTSNINNQWGVVDVNFNKKQPLWDYLASISPGSIAATFNGSGTLSATIKNGATASFSGEVSLSADAAPVLSAAAHFTGSGALEVAVFGRPAGPFTGSGALSAVVVGRQLATASFTGEGTLSAEASDKVRRDANLTGTGTLTAGVAQQRFYEHTFSGTTKPTTFTDFGAVAYRVQSSLALNGLPSSDGHYYTGGIYNIDQLSADHTALVTVGSGSDVYDRSIMAIVRSDPSGANWVGATMRSKGGDATQILSCIGGVITQRESGSDGSDGGTEFGLRAEGNVYTVVKDGVDTDVQWVDTGLLCSVTAKRTGFGFQHIRAGGAQYGTQGVARWQGQDVAATPTPVTTLVSLTGSGVLSAVVKQNPSAAFTGLGVLSARVDVVDGPRAAPFAGAGTLTATASPRLSVTAPFTGLGTLTGPLTLSEIPTPYTGTGSLTATVSTPVLWDSTGAGGRYSGAGSAGTKTVSWTHNATVTGDNVWVFVELGYSVTAALTASTSSVLYGSYPMTLLGQRIGVLNGARIYALQSPPTGLQTVTAAITPTGGAITSWQGTSVTFANVGEVLSTVGSFGHTDSARSVTVAAGPGTRALAVSVGERSSTAVSHTARYAGGGSVTGNGDYVTVQDGPGEADGSVTLTTTQGSGEWAALAVVLNPVIPPPSVNANYAGSGSLSATAELGTFTRTATFTASGVFSATVIQSLPASFTGAGGLSALTELPGTVKAPLTGSGVLSMGTPVPVLARTASFTGSGVLSTTVKRTATAALTGSGTLTATATIYSPAVTRVATGTGQSDTGTGSSRTIVIPITIPAGATMLAVGFMCSTDGWVTVSYYNTLSATSNIDGALTKSASTSGVLINQEQSSAHIFTKANPTAGVHNITCTFNPGSFNAIALYGNAAAYTNVTAVASAANGRKNSGVLNFPVTSGTNDMALMLGAWDAAAPTGFTGTTIYSAGATNAGKGEFVVFGEQPGDPSGTVTFAVTSSARPYCLAALNLES